MWPLIFASVAVSLFFYFRSQIYTEQEAQWPSDRAPGFGPQISLGAAAKEFMTHQTPRVMLLGLSVAWISRLAVGQWTPWDLLLSIGIACSWPFQEWFVHAVLEHMPPITIRGKKVELMVAKTHRAHHNNPWDPRYGLTPPFILVVFLMGLPLVSYILSPLPLALTATAVTLTFVVGYEWMHFLMHTSYPPKSSWYRRLWKHHRLHHFKNEENWYGLMATTGDTVLGTNPPVQETPHSPTCLTLGGETVLDNWIKPDSSSGPKAKKPTKQSV